MKRENVLISIYRVDRRQFAMHRLCQVTTIFVFDRSSDDNSQSIKYFALINFYCRPKRAGTFRLPNFDEKADNFILDAPTKGPRPFVVIQCV